MDKFGQMIEQFKVAGYELADKIRELIHEGNVRRIIIKDERGHTFMEIPLTVATVGVVLAPILAAVGAIAAVVARFDVVVERSTPPGPPDPPASPATDSSVGATEEHEGHRAAAPRRRGNQGGRHRRDRRARFPGRLVVAGPVRAA
jgi:hypothetical protein